MPHRVHHRRRRSGTHSSLATSGDFEWGALAVVAQVILTGWADCFSRHEEENRRIVIDTPTEHIFYGLGWYARYTGRFLVKCLAVLTLPLSVWIVYRMAMRHRPEHPTA